MYAKKTRNKPDIFGSQYSMYFPVDTKFGHCLDANERAVSRAYVEEIRRAEDGRKVAGVVRAVEDGWGIPLGWTDEM
jgi:hypothetical protein